MAFFGENTVHMWVNMDGTGTPAARASYGLSSISDNGTGDYTFIAWIIFLLDISFNSLTFDGEVS